MIKDMTQGNPTKLIISFAMPMLAGNVFQQLYNLVDTIVVGRYVGKNALAAVGSSFAIMVFITSVIIGLCMGASVVISQFFGAKQEDKLKRAVSTSFIFILGVTIFITVVTLVFTDQFLTMMKTPAEVLSDSRIYLKYIFSGLIFTFLYNIAAYLLRALGDSKTPLYFLILAALVNVVLDLVFVINFNMGVAGVAIATVIAQALSAVLCIIYSYIKLPLLHFKLREFVFDKDIFYMTARYSILTSVQQSIMSFGILMVQGLVNTFGTNAMAAFAAGAKIDSFALLPARDLGNAFSTFIAQNIGAGKIDRVKMGVQSATRSIIVICSVISVAILASAYYLILIFVKPEETQVISLGIQYIYIEGVFYVLIGFLSMFYGFFRAVGQLQISIILTVVSLGTRVLLAYTLAAIPSIGLYGVWWSIPIGWALADIIGFIKYRRGKWEYILAK